MANSYNTSQTSIPSGQAGNDTSVFIASASTTLIKSVRVVHDSGTSSATLSITKSGGGTRSDMNTVSLTAGVLTDLIDDVLPLQSGDILKVRTTHVPSEVFVSYVENTTAVQGQSIDVLADVDTTTVLPTNGQALVWDGNQWEPGTVAAGAAALDDLTDVSAANPNTGDVIEWNGSLWVTTDKVNTLYEKLKTTSGTQLYNTSLSTNQGYLDLQSTSGKLGLKQTFFNVSQTSPGVLKLTVGAGAAGAEASFDAVIVSGTTSAGSATALFRSGTQLLIEDAGGFNQWLRGSSSSTADTTVQMPDSSGQLALTSQIPNVPVDSVNSQTGVVVLDADDISDATTTNKFATAAELTKLAGIATGATANQTDAYLLSRANHTGTQTAATISDFDTEVSNNTSVVANTAKNSYPTADATKLAGIAVGATANQTDAYLLSRANHTGTQLASTISDFATEADARIGLASITDLSDTPASLVANQILRVNGTATAVTTEPKRLPYLDTEVEPDQNRIFEKSVTTTSNKIVDFLNNTLAARNNANARNMLGFYDGTDNIVLQGIVDANASISGAAAGRPLWLGTSGAFSADPPTTATEYSRIVGYYVGTGQGGEVLCYFNPSQDWVQID